MPQRTWLSFAPVSLLGAALAVPPPLHAQSSVLPSSVLLDTMSAELARASANIGKDASDARPPYYISYAARDVHNVVIAAEQGALLTSTSDHSRLADIVVRVGDPALDNTHGPHRSSAVRTVPLPLEDDPRAIARALWRGTNTEYGTALQMYLQVKTETQVRAREEDTSPDFSRETASPSAAKVSEPSPPPIGISRDQWNDRIRALSAIFRDYPHIYANYTVFSVRDQTGYFVSSEGARIIAPYRLARIVVFATTRADDGMDLFRAQTFEARTPDGLPPQKEMEAAVRKIAASLEALRTAPVTEPFDGPAVLSGRASAVFFHEVLGHRLEGQRQRGDEEGQTFTKDLGKPILPAFISVADDPTVAAFNGASLSGYYTYDDEGQRAQKVQLIENGVLKTFLMSRLPIASVSSSNGHGRSQAGHMPTGRQGNLIVTSTKTVPDSTLRQMLIDEAKKQNKPYGLYFDDISSGFAVTTRNAPQAFQVIPLVVYRVYTDGRPDELVRGVSIVGTPQAALNRIVATGDKPEIFNGECGAESGVIPVSAVAPAMLVSEIETQREQQGTVRPPILPPPTAAKAGEGN
ncbi:MAG TPA: metallopeptidase TldD-related protein [Silvibacterium sp.]|nr:metallopeptidase TldD-related protein [Silvibacterium sp.]